MTPTEFMNVMDLITWTWPQQRLEAGTPDAWYDAGLKDVSITDAKEAIRRLASTKVFISLAELLTEVRVIRRERLDREPLALATPRPPGDQASYRETLRADIARIANGISLNRALAAGRDDPSAEYDTHRAAREGEDPHRALRVAAMRKHCSRCQAPAGKRCRNAVGRDVTGVPAHEARLVAAGLARWVEDEQGIRRAELIEESS